MIHYLYTRFIEARSTNPDSQSREVILNYLLFGLSLLAVAALLGALTSFIISGYQYMALRVAITTIVAAGIIFLYYLARVRRYLRMTATIISCVFFVIAAAVIYQWGLFTPTGLLLCALVIVMSGVLVSARFSLYSLAGVAILFVAVQYGKVHGWITPDLSWIQRTSDVGDVFSFLMILAVIALVSWLFNHQMERSLQRAQRSEAALSQQKALLEVKVEERTRQLEAAQLEKIQHVYRFAELGRTSSALFHDLANHLTSMSLDIEGLKSRGRSDIMQRIKNDVQYIDDVVQRVRFQLRGQTRTEEFNVAKEITQVIKILKYKTGQARATIKVTKVSRKPIMYVGDVTRFRQLIINLLSNAIEAYPPPTGRPTKQRLVDVKIEQLFDATVCITVTDWGVGIKPAQKRKVFEPFYSKKPEGTGIGLFIVKQIIEQDMHGTIKLISSPKRGTVFTVHLPASS